MSGRVHTTLSDGRRVVGYRKTLRVQSPRTPTHLLPDSHLSFELPGTLGLGLPFYPGVIGVEVCPDGHVDVHGKNQDWVLHQAVAFLRTIAPYGLVNPIGMRLTRASEPGPTISGPPRHGIDRTMQVYFDGRCATVVNGTAMRLLSL